MTLYETHLAAAEANVWTVAGVPWDAIDHRAAAAESPIHAQLHDAAMIEGYLPVFVPRLMRLMWDDVDATAVLALELHDGLKHYTVLRRYLAKVGHQAVEDADRGVVAARGEALATHYEVERLIEHLTRFMCSELFAAYFFLRISRRTREPVLGELLTHLVRDEFRHAAGAGDLLERRMQGVPDAAERVLVAAEQFRHYGSDVVTVPLAEPNDFEAILAVDRKIRQVCGVRPVSHLRGSVLEGGG